jgi:hypothetical protein
MNQPDQTTNLQSSVNRVGSFVTEIIAFRDGSKKTFKGIDTESIEQGEFTKFRTKTIPLVGIHTQNVNYFEVHTEEVK